MFFKAIWREASHACVFGDHGENLAEFDPAVGADNDVRTARRGWLEIMAELSDVAHDSVTDDNRWSFWRLARSASRRA
jgi:hypothetical protein